MTFISSLNETRPSPLQIARRASPPCLSSTSCEFCARRPLFSRLIPLHRPVPSARSTINVAAFKSSWQRSRKLSPSIAASGRSHSTLADGQSCERDPSPTSVKSAPRQAATADTFQCRMSSSITLLAPALLKKSCSAAIPTVDKDLVQAKRIGGTRAPS
jgi:hypothetical protein